MYHQLSIFQEQANPTVKMHNHLVKANFGYMELNAMRIFLIALAKLKWDDKDLLPVKINLTDILPSYNGGNNLDVIIKACRELKTKMQDVEIFSIEDGKKVYERMTVIDSVKYVEGTNYVEAFWGRKIKPYLINLKEYYTQEELRELLKLKSTYAIRMYMLIKSLYREGMVYETSVNDFKMMMVGNLTQYADYRNFKRKVIYVAQKALEDTSSAFDFEDEKHGRSISRIKFIPRKYPSLNGSNEAMAEDLKEKLLELKVNTGKIKQMLESEQIPESYIWYVIDAKLRDKKVKKLGGAIYDAVVNKQLWADFEKSLRKPPLAVRAAIDATPKAGKENDGFTYITKQEAESMYKQEKAAGTIRMIANDKDLPFNGWIRQIKAGRNIKVEGFVY